MESLLNAHLTQILLAAFGAAGAIFARKARIVLVEIHAAVNGRLSAALANVERLDKKVTELEDELRTLNVKDLP